jgi:hypothetical protein
MRAPAAMLLLAAALACAQTSKLPPPKDDAGRDPGLAAYLARLREAVRVRDKSALLQLISPNIQNGFGGQDGEVFFRQIWELDTDRSPVWDVLQLVLSLGGVWFDQTLYCIPYVSQLFPEGLDPFEHSAVIGSGVRLREAPSPDAKVVATLTYDIVRVVRREAAWTEVRTQDGKAGFVSTAYLYSPVGYRGCIGKDNAGEWKMISLVAGD